MPASAALRRLLIVGVLAHVLAQASMVRAESELLHSMIDKLLVPVAGVTPAIASDAEFLRRVSLDLIGMPPSADEARAFISDKAPDKRARLIDRLFDSPHYARHLASALDLMLMERRPNTNVSADEWQAWLVKAVRENKPWNVLAKEIIQADGADPATRPAARFALDRASDPNVLTRDIGRIFFGRDMQCAHCHDHPLVADYLQSDYQGLLAFLQPTVPIVRNEGGKQTTLQAEQAGSQVSFQSVFVHVPRRTALRLPDGVMIDEPFFLPGEEYVVAPGDNVKSVPKFSYRAKLAELATNGSNDAFNRNIANRLWALMFGRGLVHPPDMQNPDNPPANAELLQMLAQQIVAMKFDMRAFLHEIALSQSYQRSFDPPANVLSLADQAAKEVCRLQEARGPLAKAADASMNAYTKAADAWEQAEAKSLPVAGELDTAKTKYADAKKKADEAAKAAADAASQLQAKKSVMTPVQQAAAAAQAAVKALPTDKELLDAAQKFLTRAKQLSAETEVLTKTANEKSAAVAPMTEAWNKTKPPVDAARQKVTPLTATLKETEKRMLVARDNAANDKELLASLDRRLATAQKVAKLPVLNQALAAANQAVPSRVAELATAQKLFDEFAPIAARANKMPRPRPIPRQPPQRSWMACALSLPNYRRQPQLSRPHVRRRTPRGRNCPTTPRWPMWSRNYKRAVIRRRRNLPSYRKNSKRQPPLASRPITRLSRRKSHWPPHSPSAPAARRQRGSQRMRSPLQKRMPPRNNLSWPRPNPNSTTVGRAISRFRHSNRSRPNNCAGPSSVLLAFTIAPGRPRSPHSTKRSRSTRSNRTIRSKRAPATSSSNSALTTN